MRWLRRVVVVLIAAQGLFAGPAWAQYGNALDFLGDDDYVELPNESQFDFSTTMTVEAWIWVREFDTSWQANAVTRRIADFLGWHLTERPGRAQAIPRPPPRSPSLEVPA